MITSTMRERVNFACCFKKSSRGVGDSRSLSSGEVKSKNEAGTTGLGTLPGPERPTLPRAGGCFVSKLNIKL